MPLLTVPASDPRCQILAYLTHDGKHLVVDDSRGVLVIENCRTGTKQTISRITVGSYTLVKAAPACPDTPPQPQQES